MTSEVTGGIFMQNIDVMHIRSRVVGMRNRVHNVAPRRAQNTTVYSGDLEYDSDDSEQVSTVSSEEVSPFQEAKDRNDGTEFYTQTLEDLFTKTVANVVFVLLIVLMYWILWLARLLSDPGPLLVDWCVTGLLVVTLGMATTQYAFASLFRLPNVSNRNYMMVTQAYCGIVSVVTSVFSLITVKCTTNDKWAFTFLQHNGGIVTVLTSIFLAAFNIQWLISVALAYSCTPYGQSSNCFLQLPVAFSFVLFFILSNETVAFERIVCNSYWWVLIFTNMALITSWVFSVLSAVEFDYWHILPAFQHSSVDTDIRFDMYAFLHGFCILLALAVYEISPDTDLPDDITYTAYALGGFTVLVTSIQSIDFYWLLAKILRVDNELERRISTLQKAFAVSYLQAKEMQEALDKIKAGKNNTRQSSTFRNNSRKSTRVPDDYETGMDDSASYNDMTNGDGDYLPDGNRDDLLTQDDLSEADDDGSEADDVQSDADNDDYGDFKDGYQRRHAGNRRFASKAYTVGTPLPLSKIKDMGPGVNVREGELYAMPVTNYRSAARSQLWRYNPTRRKQTSAYLQDGLRRSEVNQLQQHSLEIQQKSVLRRRLDRVPVANFQHIPVTLRRTQF